MPATGHRALVPGLPALDPDLLVVVPGPLAAAPDLLLLVPDLPVVNPDPLAAVRVLPAPGSHVRPVLAHLTSILLLDQEMNSQWSRKFFLSHDQFGLTCTFLTKQLIKFIQDSLTK